MASQTNKSAIERRGLLLVLSSPSGAGKTTLARRLLAADAGISMSVSVTTSISTRRMMGTVGLKLVDDFRTVGFLLSRMPKQGSVAKSGADAEGYPVAPTEHPDGLHRFIVASARAAQPHVDLQAVVSAEHLDVQLTCGGIDFVRYSCDGRRGDAGRMISLGVFAFS